MAEHILVIDGDAVVRSTVARILEREGFAVRVAADAGEALAHCENEPELGLVVTGLGANELSALDALRQVKRVRPGARAVVISDGEASQQARGIGMDGHLIRPFDMDELIATLGRLSAELQVERERNVLLERLRHNVVTMVNSLAAALEARDPYTAGHSQRVADYSVMIGEAIGLSEFELEVLHHGAVLHDIGKIAVKQEVLHKPGRLTDDEYEHIKIHPVVGREILEPIEDFQTMLDLVYYHHERIDGRGYPEGLAGAQIPLLAQIVAVADTYDAMTSDRPYRAGMPPEKAFAIMREVAGSQLNGEFVEILTRRVRAELQREAAHAEQPSNV